VISLGAGYDTQYFNMKASKKYNFEKIRYFEIDLPGVIKKKIHILHKHKEILELVGQYS